MTVIFHFAARNLSKPHHVTNCKCDPVVLAHPSNYDVLTGLWEPFETAPLLLLSVNTGAQL